MIHSEWIIEYDIIYNNDVCESHWMKMTIDSTTNDFPNEDDIYKIYKNELPDMNKVTITNRYKINKKAL